MSRITQALRSSILDHFLGLSFWSEYWDSAAVVIIGSSVRGVDDRFNDIDIVGFVDAGAWPPIYEHYRREIRAGNISVLDPSALEHDEIPLISIDKVDGDYKVETFEGLERVVVGDYDDVKRWVHASSLILHDPTGRYADIRRQCSEYPEDIWHAKLKDHYFEARKAASGAKNSLRRNEREAVVLTMTRCVSHLLKLCRLMDRQPFPSEKWLYKEAMTTVAGSVLRGEFERFFRELGRPEIRRTHPGTYETPGDRDADLEEYPIFDVWRRSEEYFDAILPFKQ